MNVNSYISANALPLKCFKQEIINSGGNIKPIHIQLNPTNVCNLTCGFCSCANRQKKSYLDMHQIKDILSAYALLGCKAATITGGGEPLLHPHINEIIQLCNHFNIKVGLVTNGTQFSKLNPETYKFITWCRISHSDDRAFTITNSLNRISESAIDMAFSYVLTSNFNVNLFSEIVRYANKYHYTHVRIVSDLLNLDSVDDMEKIKEKISNTVDDSRVIYQGRKMFTSGAKKCLISLLKPVISADGGIFPCCGIQYALKEHSLDYEKSMMMAQATIEEIYDIYQRQKHFDGSICYRCYYNEYNVALDMLTQPIEHLEFV